MTSTHVLRAVARAHHFANNRESVPDRRRYSLSGYRPIRTHAFLILAAIEALEVEDFVWLKMRSFLSRFSSHQYYLVQWSP